MKKKAKNIDGVKIAGGTLYTLRAKSVQFSDAYTYIIFKYYNMKQGFIFITYSCFVNMLIVYLYVFGLFVWNAI